MFTFASNFPHLDVLLDTKSEVTATTPCSGEHSSVRKNRHFQNLAPVSSRMSPPVCAGHHTASSKKCYTLAFAALWMYLGHTRSGRIGPDLKGPSYQGWNWARSASWTGWPRLDFRDQVSLDRWAGAGYQCYQIMIFEISQNGAKSRQKVGAKHGDFLATPPI